MSLHAQGRPTCVQGVYRFDKFAPLRVQVLPFKAWTDDRLIGILLSLAL